MLHYLIRYLRKTCTEHGHTTDTQNGKKEHLYHFFFKNRIFRSKFVLQFKIIKKGEIKKKKKCNTGEKKVTIFLQSFNVALLD